jgi:hexosaminidase
MIRFSLGLAFAWCAQAAAPALMPLPARMDPGSGRLAIDNSFQIAVSGVSDPRLDGAAARITARISRQTGIPMLTSNGKPAVRVACAARGRDYPTLGEDESYTLDVAADSAVVKAPTVAGAMHGLETFAQLVTSDGSGFYAPAVHIEDRPRFPWRGLMLDACRHWMPLEVVKRNLDAMAAVKLNVFHWHLSEDQGFRVESKKFPKLQEMGSDGLYYTQAEIRDVVAYARDRGIRVVPEFDIPGHTQSWLVGYPELGTVPGPFTIGRTWGIYQNVLDPSKEATYQFLDTFFGEITELFPDPYWHIGGDEVVAQQWNSSPQVQAWAKEHNLKDAHAIQAFFNQRVQKLLQKYNKILIGWDEVLHPDLPQDIVVQSWRGAKSLADAASKGYRGILSSGFYLDHLEPARQHYAVDPLGGDVDKLTPEQQSHVVGGEACMWSEYVTSETVDSRIWPRAAAIAERYWSPQATTDVSSLYDRMEAVSRQLEWTGVKHRANYQPMLDRISGGKPNQPLRVLGDAVEGVGLGPRARAQKYTSLVPMNRLPDAARPESESVRALERAAAKVAADPKGSAAETAALRRAFTEWAENDARFVELADNALLKELLPLSKDLSALGVAGLRLLDCLEKGTALPSGFGADESKEVTRFARPVQEVTMAAARPVKVLLEAARK